MSPAAAAFILLAASEPPVDPNREEARRWATEELSKQQYVSAQPNWFEELWNHFIEWLRSLNGNSIEGPGFGLPLIGALAVVLIVVAVIVVRPRLNARRKMSAEVFDDDAPAHADVFRSRAAAAASREDWATAVVEQFRAVVRAAEERAVIDVQPGRTADEAAAQLGRAFAPAGTRLEQAARLFDAVKYGNGAASAADFTDVLALDSELAASKPDYSGSASIGLAVPR